MFLRVMAVIAPAYLLTMQAGAECSEYFIDWRWLLRRPTCSRCRLGSLAV